MVYVAFLWHFHQPSYWDPIRQMESMPWVRLHSIKGYSDMAEALEKHPQVKANVNVVPSLLDRWVGLADNGFEDEYFQMATIPATDLKPEEKEFLLLRFFQANWDTMINPYPRYHQLLVKRGHRLTPSRLSAAVEGFSNDDFRDLQVWFDLSWFGYSAAERFQEIRELRHQDRGFTEEDKVTVQKLQQQVISELIPRYKRLWESGQVEITTTPYYHPILPLLVDNQCARQGLPREPMPTEHFQAPEDAKVHLERAVARIEEIMGKRPVGLWPSEGSVSKEALQLAAETGFQWAASDEGILFQTLGKSREASLLYQPYLLQTEPPIAMVFRDHGLSDAIGFRYSKLTAAQAMQEFLGHLRVIERSFRKEKKEPLVSVILDGENPWEYFPDGGKGFLSQLYDGLESTAIISTVSVSDYLANNPPKERLTTIFPGSWINGNFRVWIGDKEKNQAWDLLARTRKMLAGEGTCQHTILADEGVCQRMDAPPLVPPRGAGGKGCFASLAMTPPLYSPLPRRGEEEDLTKHVPPNGDPPYVPPCNSRGDAWEALYRAEGSDWFWWFGDINNSDNDAEFDRLFRNNLKEIYKLLGKAIPLELERPIGKIPGMERRMQPAFAMTPVLDGKVTSYYEWIGACRFDVSRAGGTMSLPDARVQRIFYGFDDNSLYLRVDFRKNSNLDGQAIQIVLEGSPEVRIEVQRNKQTSETPNPMRLFRKAKGEWQESGMIGQSAWDEVLEVQIPLNQAEIQPGQEVGFHVLVLQNDIVMERWPLDGVIQFVIPGVEDLVGNWCV